MQCSAAVSAGTPAIPEPEDHSADLDPPPYNTLPPNEVAEPHIHQPPKQIRAPHRSWRAVGVIPGRADAARNRLYGPDIGACTRGRDAHRIGAWVASDLPDLQKQGSTVWEPEPNDPKAHVRAHQAQMPVLDEGTRVRRGPWPNLGVVTIYPDTCKESTSLLEPLKTSAPNA